MTMLRATIKGRRLELDVPADWPDGTEVEIHPMSAGSERHRRDVAGGDCHNTRGDGPD